MLFIIIIINKWHKRNIFHGGGGKVTFPDFFPIVKCFSPVEIYILVHPKQNSVVSKNKNKQKKKQKKKNNNNNKQKQLQQQKQQQKQKTKQKQNKNKQKQKQTNKLFSPFHF